MENWINSYAGRTCTCDHHAPPKLVLRSIHYVQALAAFLASLDHSPEEVAEWLVHMLLDVHQAPGRLYDHMGRECDLRENVGLYDQYLHQEDLCSCMKRIINWSRVARKRRLRKEALRIVEALSWAAAIHQCVTDGPCSRR